MLEKVAADRPASTCRQFARFLEKLDETKDVDGQSLLHNSMIVYGCGNADGNRHTHDNLPVILAGGGGGTLTPGRYVKAGGVPMTNLFLEHGRPPRASRASTASATRPAGSTRSDPTYPRPTPDGHLHADRATGRDRDHRRPDRAPAGGAGGARRPGGPVRQQPEAARPGGRQLREQQRCAPPDRDGRLERRALENDFSMKARVLFFMEQAAVYNALNQSYYALSTTIPASTRRPRDDRQLVPLPLGRQQPRLHLQRLHARAVQLRQQHRPLPARCSRQLHARRPGLPDRRHQPPIGMDPP